MIDEKYPECFPKNFERDILPKGIGKDEKDVYRIIKNGIIERNSFISTYEEIKSGAIPSKKNMDLQDPELYSTSCFIERAEAEYLLNIFMRHHPKPIISKGKTKGICGPNQLTSERKKNSNPSHVDWWIYEKATPQLYFKED